MQIRASKKGDITKAQVFVIPELKEYTEGKVLKYYRYVCPICDKAGVVHGLCERQPTCNVCGIKFFWTPVVEQKSKIATDTGFFDLRTGFESDKSGEKKDETKPVDTQSQEFQNKLEALRNVMKERHLVQDKLKEKAQEEVKENKPVEEKDEPVKQKKKPAKRKSKAVEKADKDGVVTSTRGRGSTVCMYRLYDAGSKDLLGVYESTSLVEFCKLLKSEEDYLTVKSVKTDSMEDKSGLGTSGVILAKQKDYNIKEMIYVKIKKSEYADWLEINEVKE